ncbi:SpoIIE family protein phosphatase [Streptacidiphilus monticola]|uniref:SpoIIE family protein phosphatase n=1 Tax=Streptacidiphilus monticola TaxID=2161674 RepID=A0ABW1GA52_9ACTN
MSRTAEAEQATGPVDVALDETLATTLRSAGASAGALFLLSAGEPTLHLAAVCGIPVEFATPWRRVPLAGTAPVAEAVRRNQLVWVGCQEDLARRYPRTAVSLPYQLALAAVPLRGERRTWGALLLLWPAPRRARPTRRERTHLATAARRLSRLLDTAPRPPSLPAQPRVVAYASAMPQPSQTALAAADWAERLPEGAVALDLGGRITFCSATAARLLGRGADELLGTLPWRALPWLDDPVPEDHYRTALISREPVAFTALRPPDQWLSFELYPDGSGISVRITPAPSSTRPGSRSVRTGPRTGAAHEPTGRLYQLVHLAAAFTESVGVRDVVDLVAGQVLPAFDAEGLVLNVAEAGRLKIIGHQGYAHEEVRKLDGLPLHTDLTPAGQVLLTGAPAFFRDRTEMGRLYPRALGISRKQAWAFLPLVLSGRPVGCCILSYDHPHEFGADERAVLTSLAGLIAQALDRARLYDAKHELAYSLQRSLLPRSLLAPDGLEVAARYLPAVRGLDVGGDFYDLIRLDDRSVAAVIGDVQGHDASSAALMGQVRTAVRAHATAGAAPDQVLARTNRLLADVESDLLVSCLYAHLDLSRCQLTLASAGHLPPLLRRPDRRAGSVPLEPGPLLGIDAEERYPVTSVTVPQGAVLALFTDGLLEVPGTDLDRTTAVLTDYLAHAAVTDLDLTIDGMVHRLWPTGEHTDDVAVLLLRLDGTGHRDTGRAARRGSA